MPRGEHFYGIFRTSKKRYTSRPPANCRSARKAWDFYAKSGTIIWIQLLDGYWGCERPDGSIDEIENTWK